MAPHSTILGAAVLAAAMAVRRQGTQGTWVDKVSAKLRKHEGRGYVVSAVSMHSGLVQTADERMVYFVTCGNHP